MPLEQNYLTRVQVLSVRVHSKAIARAARRRAIPARRVSFSLSDPARITAPPSASLLVGLYAVSIVSFTPTFCPRDTRRLHGTARRGATRAGMPRAARRRISVIAMTRRKGGKGHVGYLAVPYESVCASYVVRQSTRRLRRVRGGLNINGDASAVAAAAATTAIPFRHTSSTGCGSRTDAFLH